MATSTPTVPRVVLDSVVFRDDLPYQLSDPAEPLIADTARVVVAKDAPIIAAARAAKATIVATYDRKDLLSKRQEILDAFGVTVATPEEILAALEHVLLRDGDTERAGDAGV